MAWDDTKGLGSLLTATEWNNHVTDQKGLMDVAGTRTGSNLAIAGSTESTTYYFTEEYSNGSWTTGSQVIDWNNGQKQEVVLSASGSLVLTNPTGVGNFLLKLVQDGTGTRTVDYWDADVLWAGGSVVTLSTAAASVDIVSFYFDGTKYYASGLTGFQ